MCLFMSILKSGVAMVFPSVRTTHQEDQTEKKLMKHNRKL